MGVTVHTQGLQRRFVAPFASCANCLNLSIVFLSLILPFFLAYSGSGPTLWLKHATYLEQPTVHYEHKTIVILEGTKNDDEPLTLFFSSMSSLNNAFSQYLRVPVLRSTEIDENYDFVTDRIDIQAVMPLQNNERIYSAKLLTFFGCKIRKYVHLSVETLGYFSHASPQAGQSLYIDGDLLLHQRWPIQVNKGSYTPYEDFFDPTELMPWQDGSYNFEDFLPNLIATYRQRNYTMDVDQQYTLWTGLGGGARKVNAEFSSFNLTATVYVPQQPIIYSPTLREVLFDGWIKYLTLLVVVLLLLNAIKDFLLSTQLIESTVIVDNAPVAAANRFKLHRY